MHTYSILELLRGKAPENNEVVAQGWVKTRRDSSQFSFITLNDGSCLASLQIIAPQSLKNYQTEVLHLTSGCAIKVRGKLVRSQGKGQAYELQAESVDLIGDVENPETYPISPKHHTLEYLREHAHLRPRTNTIGAITRIRQVTSWAIHNFFNNEGFCWINTPIITANDCEGAGALFKVSTLDFTNLPKNEANQIDYTKDFFGKEVFLTVSGQLDVESYCLAMSKVYTFGPTFRAENSNTSRHLAEFWMIEPEIAFANLNDLIILAEKFLKFITKNVLEHCEEDLKFCVERVDKNCISRLENLVASKFVQLEYVEAIKILQNSKQKFNFKVERGLDLQSEHERYLVEEYIKQPVAVINYPKQIKSFYMRLNEDETTVAAMDILAPGVGEIIGGSQREERLQFLDRRMLEMKVENCWYQDLRRYGSVPHAGFGMGLERFLMYVTGINNIRDVIPFPRVPGNIEL